jgi:CelD/BcsL family acetyltransferase involved in cellulose biosynthesis
VDPLATELVQSASELRALAPAWDELWRRSGSTRPTSCAAHIGLWHQAFASTRPLVAVLVRDQGQLVAALPLVAGRRFGLSAWFLPGNAWSPAGELLLDPQVDALRACAAIVAGAARLGRALLAADGVCPHQPAWRHLQAALERGGMPVAVRPWFDVPTVELRTSWQDYFAGRSRNLRRQARAAARRADQSAPTRLERYDELVPEQVEPVLRSCFEVEATGWKGRRQSAVLCVAGAWEFYAAQARQLARAGQLSIAILRHGRWPVAFEYGWRAAGAYSVLKVGYHEAFGEFSPGQLLRYWLLSELFAEGQLGEVDFLGPICPATARWATGSYPVERQLAALGSALSRAAVRGYQALASLAGVRTALGDAPSDVRSGRPDGRPAASGVH